MLIKPREFVLYSGLIKDYQYDKHNEPIEGGTSRRVTLPFVGTTHAGPPLHSSPTWQNCLMLHASSALAAATVYCIKSYMRRPK
jgi:hypothetical protein